MCYSRREARASFSSLHPGAARVSGTPTHITSSQIDIFPTFGWERQLQACRHRECAMGGWEGETALELETFPAGEEAVTPCQFQRSTGQWLSCTSHAPEEPPRDTWLSTFASHFLCHFQTQHIRSVAWVSALKRRSLERIRKCMITESD